MPSLDKDIPAVGSKLKVWNGSAKHTAGGVHKSGLLKKPDGRIVFRKKSEKAKQTFRSNPKIREALRRNQFQPGSTRRSLRQRRE